MSDAQAVTVHLVEDDANVRRAIGRLLEARGFNVANHASAEDFLAAWWPQDLGCAIVDLTLPGIDGLRLQARMEADGAGFPIIFLTGTGDIEKSVAAMKGGAVDFLTKPVDAGRLIEAVTAALERDAARHSERVASLQFAESLSSLTPRESEVLDCIVEGLMNKQIADRLGLSVKTVKIHRGRVMQKLGAHTAAQLAALVVKYRSRRM